MSMKLTGIKATKQLLDALEDIPKKIVDDVLKDSIDDCLAILRKHCPKDSGKSVTYLEVLQYKTDGERYWSWEIGFDGNKWQLWKGAFFNNFYGLHSSGEHIGWISKAGKEINQLINRRLQTALNKYLRSLK